MSPRILMLTALLTASAVAQDREVSLEDLERFEERVMAAGRKGAAATVGLRIGASQGSGVIVTPEGIILTAAHVFPEAGGRAQVTLADGKRVFAKTLGRQEQEDFGLLKLEGDGPWPYVEMGRSADLAVGDPCIALGHPGGVQPGRTAPLRFGRVTSVPEAAASSAEPGSGPNQRPRRGGSAPRFLRTSCTINRGDSGGPLLDLDARVVGIHSRINARVTSNFHVPVDRYRESWERLLAGEEWGEEGADFPAGPVIGVEGIEEDGKCVVRRVFRGTPADKAGVKVGDVIVELGGEPVETMEDVRRIKGRFQVGETVTLEVLRAEKPLTFQLTLTEAP